MKTRGTQGGSSVNGVGRRQFLAGAAAAAATTAIVGCSSDSDDATEGTAGPTTTTPVPVKDLVPKAVPTLKADPFTLGVASGDPDDTSLVLWTRLAPEPFAEDGLGGMPDEPADVIWEVADDAKFTKLRASGIFTTEAEHVHSAHVLVEGLPSGATIHYRFRYADWVSPAGKAATLPTTSPDSFRIAIANCQMYEAGYWAAYDHMVEDEPDLIVHLGDYIYEYAFDIIKDRVPYPQHNLETLTDFRLRYATYKNDPVLQKAHAAAPFIITWDDHEVANNYMADVLPGAIDATVGIERKTAAYRAWWEHQATRLEAPTKNRLDLFQAVTVGDLFRLHLLDERQYADLPPCRSADTSVVNPDEGDCAERTGEDRDRLGPDQTSWLTKSLAKGGVTWNLLGNPVVLAGVNAGQGEDMYYLDTWDGFPQARERLIALLAKADNPVVLTGDYHAGMTLEVREKPFNQSSALVAAEFMSPPISSMLFSADVSGRTPQLLEQINAHGYLTVDVTAKKLTVAFRCLDDVGDPKSPVKTAATWEVAAGDPTPKQV